MHTANVHWGALNGRSSTGKGVLLLPTQIFLLVMSSKHIQIRFLFTRLRSRRVVMCLVVVYVRSFVCSYIRLFVRSFPHKPATHYSSLFFANNDQIIFSRKNLNFAKRGENTPTHCSSSTAVFANMNFVFRATKNCL